MLGFQLQADDGLEGGASSFTVVYDSGNNPLGTLSVVTGLLAARTYSFVVYVRDINGLGAASPTASFLACLSPAGLAAPVLTAVSKTTFAISWSPPSSDGGCALTAYALTLSSDQDAVSPAVPTY